MKKTNVIWLILGIILIVLLLVWFSMETEKPEVESKQEEIVKQYIEENISELSPKEAVLGGTFYVTNIDFIDHNLAIVEYEDGHIALEAQVVYSVVNNMVNINSFQILEEEEEVLSDNDLVINYIKDNISELSPEKEVLGGTFYVTNIDFIDHNLAIVEYEDGHIALEAEVMFSIENKEVSIKSFKLID